MAYIANKLCRFSGTNYAPGAEIPSEKIPPFAAQRLLKQGVIIQTATTASMATTSNTNTFTFPILSNKGTAEINVNLDDLITALKIIQRNADDAVEEINACNNVEVLLMVNVLDSRKSVKKAADNRAKECEGGDE